MNTRITSRLILAALLLGALLLCAGAVLAEELPAPDPARKVDRIEMHQLPDKTVYLVGEPFETAGGIIRITYKDGDVAYIALDDSAVSVKAPTMNTVNTKNVQVRYEGAKLTFKVEVVAGMCSLTFDQNYEGAPAPQVVEATKGSRAEAPAAPVREGYAFLGWYADPDFVRAFDFTAPVQTDASVYALWLKEGAESVTVTFDYGYYGVLLNQYSYPLEKGTAVREPSAVPERLGYTFVRWLSRDGEAFDFSQTLQEDTVITAEWACNVTTPETWVFEAEDTDLRGKIGPSYSGSAQEESMIIYNPEIGASGDRVVGYLYAQGITLEFWIASDRDVEDAQLAVRVSGEYTTMSYDGNDFQVLVNGAAKLYPKVTVPIEKQSDVAPCEDLILLEGVALKQGENLIQLKTNNTNAVPGTTFSSNAPMVDCLKITASAVLIWDENHGEPALTNYKK